MILTSRQIAFLVMRMQSDFLHTPRLGLTLSAAERRFGVSQDLCEAVLDALVESQVLTRRADGAYVRFFPRLAHAA